MSAGHSTARNLSLRLWRKECTTHPSGTRGFSHLFNVALAELELQFASLQYFGKAKSELHALICLPAHKEKPTSGICRLLEPVFNLRQGCSFNSMNGESVSIWISEANNPQASDNLIPLSLIRAISQRGSSSRVWQFDCMHFSAWSGIGARCCFTPSSGMKVPLNILLIASPCSRIARLTMDLTQENTHFTDEDDIPLANK